MLLHRVLTAAAAIPLVLLAAYTGGPFFLALMVLVAVLALAEWQRLADHISPAGGQAAGYPIMLAVFAGGYLGSSEAIFGAAAVVFVLTALLMVYGYPQQKTVGVFINVFGQLYIGFSFAALWRLRSEMGFIAILTLLIIIWVTDSGAYFSGRAWGKKKLAPVVSPKKTWVGFFGGIGAAVLAAVIIGLFWQVGVPVLVAAALFASLAAQLGDLAESVMKRTAGVKDSGSILPGHGGILDRIDSMLLAAPVVYIFLSWFIID